MFLPLFSHIILLWIMDVSGILSTLIVNIILYLLWIQEDESVEHGIGKDVLIIEILHMNRFGTRIHRYHCCCSFIVGLKHFIEISFDRISRVYYINKRWKGPIIYSVLFCDRNTSDLYRFLDQPFEERITFIVYMCALEEGEPYINYNNTHVLKTSGHPYLYPFNVLRSLGIEYIQTTHYLLLDCDIFISGW